jgi:hypothetical protein
MQIRPKTYLHFMSAWRSLRDAIPPRDGAGPAETSPFLIYIAVILAFFLVVLEVDAHRGELKSLGLLGHDDPIQASFMGP